MTSASVSLALALSDGLLLLQRQQGRWQISRHLDGLPTQCLAADPLRPERLYCGTFGSGLWASADGGRSWHPTVQGMRSPQIMAVAVSAVERVGTWGVIYAGTEPSALYRSEDGGATWQELPGLLALPSAPTWSFPPRPSTSHVRAIGLDPLRAGVLVVAIEAGALVRSFDAGATWEDRQPGAPVDTHTLGLPRQKPGCIYAAAGDGFLQPGQGFAESHDGGTTWERPSAGLRHHYLWGLAVDPADPDTLVVSAAAGPQQAHDVTRADSAIYWRVGEGPWQQAQEGLPAAQGMMASALAAHDAEPDTFYAANNQGVYCSTDAGRTWEQLAFSWPDWSEPQHRQRAQSLLVLDAD
jgi:photosystem II stability/assembly factor-like uncharacterized protein